MSFAFRLLPRVPLLLCLSLAILTARRRPEARPVAWALAGMACLDVARLAPLPPRLDAWAWLMWPAVSAALSWRVWAPRRDVGPDNVIAWFVAYATALVLVPGGWWPAHAWAWTWASHAPYVAGPLASLLAWALRKDERPDVGGTSGRSMARGRALSGKRGDEPTPSASLSQAVAAVIAWSSFLDAAVGALVADSPWWRSWVTSAATYAVVGAMLVRWRIRSSN